MTLVENTLKNNKYFCKKCRDYNLLIECGCGFCNKIIISRDKSGRYRNMLRGHYIKNPKNNPTKEGDQHSMWKGGRVKYKEKYWYLYMPDYFHINSSNYIPEHVYFYEQYHKCCMLKWGIVHHKEPVRKDYCNNMPWNLEGMTRKQHMKLHDIKYSK